MIQKTEAINYLKSKGILSEEATNYVFSFSDGKKIELAELLVEFVNQYIPDPINNNPASLD